MGLTNFLDNANGNSVFGELSEIVSAVANNNVTASVSY